MTISSPSFKALALISRTWLLFMVEFVRIPLMYTLGICYWNVDGLPKELVRVPVDPFEKAILWLKNKGYEKIIMYGISKGAELGFRRL